jgi:hypothetical protein
MITETKKKKRVRPYSKRGLSSEQPFTECVCPKCEKRHSMRLKWIGRGIPKKFCERCKARIGGNRFGLPYEVHFYTLNQYKER